MVHTRPAVPPIATLQQMQMPTLPLPPPLPWSPDSQPFLRHMHMLSLALLAESPDKSWEIYAGLHPDVLKDVPDDVFSALLSHQLHASDNVRAERVRDLLSLAAECNMDPAALGRPVIEEALQDILTSAARQVRSPARHKTRFDYKTIDWLWSSLKLLVNDDLSEVPLIIRREWLAVSAFRYHRDVRRIHKQLQDVIELKGGEGIDEQAGRIISMAKHKSSDLIEDSLRLSAWCVARGVNIRPLLISRLIGYLRQAWNAKGADGAEHSQSAALALAAELREGGAYAAADVFEGVVRDIVSKTMSFPRRVKVLEDNPDSTMDDIYKVAAGIFRKETADTSQLGGLVELCRLATTKDGNPEALLRQTVKLLANRPSGSDDIVLALADHVCGYHQAGGSVTPQLLSRLFELVLGVPDSPATYKAAYRLYPLVRASESPHQHRWLPKAASSWNRLFSRAVESGQIFFASRLYADFQSDGLTVPRNQQLSFIEKIASTESISRSILLDRHIKDYLWDESAPVDGLATAIVRGMSATGAKSTVEGLRLARRITRALPVKAIEAALPPLASSGTKTMRALAYALLQQLPVSEARRGYEIVLETLVKNIKVAGLEPILAVVHDMFQRQIPAATKTASLIAVAFMKSSQLDAAVTVFEAAAKRGVALTSASVGQLMVNLADAGRCEEAYDVERGWRDLVKSHDFVYDKGVYGARLHVDIKAGRDVDLSQFATYEDGQLLLKAKDGYKPNRRYYEFLAGLQRAPDGPPVPHAEDVAPNEAPAQGTPPSTEQTQEQGEEGKQSGPRVTTDEVVA